MLKNNLGYPRIGNHRELKKACENYWSGKISLEELLNEGVRIRRHNWHLQKISGIDLIPSNDFSFYDQVLDMSLILGTIPERYRPVLEKSEENLLDVYFAMARGYQASNLDVPAMEMTKWFDTNYHYIVPEFTKNQEFGLLSKKAIEEFCEAKEAGYLTKPVLIGPVSYLLLGKEKEEGFHRLDLLPKLLPVYSDLLQSLHEKGAEWVQLDEPFLALDLDDEAREAFHEAYHFLKTAVPNLKTILTTYFEGLADNIRIATNLPVCALHIDLIRDPDQLETILDEIPEKMTLSLGVVEGRNVWKTDYKQAISLVEKAISKIGNERIMIAASCSLLHVPCDLECETMTSHLPEEVKQWMAFARQKLEEIKELALIVSGGDKELLKRNAFCISSKKASSLIHNDNVKRRLKSINPALGQRASDFATRQLLQQNRFKLPLFPTTTIGSFPQTKEVRQLRAKFKRKEIDKNVYEGELKKLTNECIRKQEEIGLDVLVHGEFERNDMVEYFGEQLEGFAFTTNGWVQSYGSRCVKPPIIYGDISRSAAMTVFWSEYAQSLTYKPVKGMLTGPVTILQWSFVRNDQTRKDTCLQIALAIRDEVADLEKAGITIIQIDEPALREGLPLRIKLQKEYLDWAVFAFRVASSGVSDETQIHTHMCYSEFNDIIQEVAAMDADVITIETSRSQMELLKAFEDFNYPNEIGPGVYDIHSPRIPAAEEMTDLLEKAIDKIPVRNIWVNPDCGLKTRGWKETETALRNMVKAAERLREITSEAVVK